MKYMKVNINSNITIRLWWIAVNTMYRVHKLNNFILFFKSVNKFKSWKSLTKDGWLTSFASLSILFCFMMENPFVTAAKNVDLVIVYSEIKMQLQVPTAARLNSVKKLHSYVIIWSVTHCVKWLGSFLMLPSCNFIRFSVTK